MTGQKSAFPSGQLAKLLTESAQRSSSLHRQLLQMRLGSLRSIQAMIAMQINAMTQEDAHPTPGTAPARPELFNSRQLDEFGTGKISNCLGPAFARYDNQRIPRIPNGDLKLMSRVTQISGKPREFTQPASVTVEYDVPASAWYLRDNAYPDIPWSVWMEIALQPCGFLSAYMDTYASVLHKTFYFRNLDGSIQWLGQPAFPGDLRGQTITTHARLLSSITSGETVIQKFSFELRAGEQIICRGESMFGYFSAETMANQVGLDGGKQALPWLHTQAYQGQPGYSLNSLRQPPVPSSKPYFRLSQGQMNFVDDIFVLPNGGKNGQGYVYASRPVNGQDWFYPCHFYQDPVMPGSLGVEAIMQSIQAFALSGEFGQAFHSPRFGLAHNQPPMNWRYRGQITPNSQLMELEAHLTGIRREAGSTVLLADASLWVDGLRIYEVNNAAIGILEG
jgi:3-hydroxymyristoyl/3-hydroxydecanoyl-(acyl carrier protein) dehydratase